MKKQIIILFLFIIPFSSWSQKTIKTTTPCDDELLFKTPGRWLTKVLLDNGSEYIGFNSAQIKEVTNRMDAVHQLMLKIYPHPMAIDAVWHPTIGAGSFGEQVKYVKKSQGVLGSEVIKVKQVARFGYVSVFFRYYCNPKNAHEIWPGYPGVSGTRFYVFANNLDPAAGIPRTGDSNYTDDLAAVLTIGGYPMRLRHSLNKRSGEFEILSLENFKERWIIIHRKGMLPYIPVTRKQYLDRCIIYITNWWNNSIMFLDQMPDQQVREEQKKKAMNERDAALKRYREELDETTKAGLLDAPAIIPVDIFDTFPEDRSIFTDEKDGKMIVIENADYMRKDLPKYVPQFFVLRWQWDDWKPQADIGKLIEEKFPFEKLREMLDK